MRVAAVQLDSTIDRADNLARAEALVRSAAADGAQLVVLPEHFDMRAAEDAYLEHAETLRGDTVRWARNLAAALEIDLIAGSIAERRPGRERFFNTSVHVGPDGELKGAYRKVHLFDASVAGFDYRESDSCERGDERVVSHTADGTPIGLSVCYDVRFPELYRTLTLDGALVVTVPSNFTRPTGEAHWEVLLRARAIENQLFVIAPAQAGTWSAGEAYGHALIVDPWGDVLADAGADGERYVAADLDLDRQRELRTRLPTLDARVPDAYRRAPAAAGACA
jgi:deaminated glutathione amidase